MNSPNTTNHESAGIIKIVGIGQRLRGDDAAGLEAVRLWMSSYQAKVARPNIIVELAELPGIALLSLLEGARFAILVDTVQSDAKAGTIHVLSENQLEAFQECSGSAHGWGVAETLALGRRLDPSLLPEKLLVIGIEAGELEMGESLSPEVQQALPEVARLIDHYISAYNK